MLHDVLSHNPWVVFCLLAVVLIWFGYELRKVHRARQRQIRTSILLLLRENPGGLTLMEMQTRLKKYRAARVKACWCWLRDNLYIQPSSANPLIFRVTPLGDVRLTGSRVRVHKDFSRLSNSAAA